MTYNTVDKVQKSCPTQFLSQTTKGHKNGILINHTAKDLTDNEFLNITDIITADKKTIHQVHFLKMRSPCIFNVGCHLNITLHFDHLVNIGSEDKTNHKSITQPLYYVDR